jgi:signal transduction histidine kinase
LRELAARGRTTYGFEVELRSDIAADVDLSEASASHLYRIAQEALTNAARHARASLVRIALAVSRKRVVLEISDNGVGIGMNRRAASGMGLKIMKYRASMIGAKCEVVANQPQGTVIRVTGEQTVAFSTAESVHAI